MTNLNLVVIRSSDPSTAVKFYESLGLEFVREKHGSGPVHFAAEFGEFVFEIYPSKRPELPEKIRLGFRVETLELTVDSIRDIGGTVISNPQESPWGLRAVVQDPDGRKIELTQSRED